MKNFILQLAVVELLLSANSLGLCNSPCLQDRITFYRKTENSNKVYQEVTSSLKRIPAPIANQLVNSGLRIVITPTIVEAWPEYANRKPDWSINATYENCPALYRSVEHTVYIAEEWKGFKNSTISHSVLHESGHAYDKLQRYVSQSSVFKELLDDDANQLSEKRRKQLHYDQSVKTRARELYAEFFATALTPYDEKKATVEEQWYHSLSHDFPKAYRFVSNSLTVVK